MNALPFILLGVLLNAAAQLLLKSGMNHIGHFNIRFPELIPIGYQIATNPYIIIGLMCYVLSVAVWLIALSRVDVSYAYPMLSLGYVVTAIASYYLFNEYLSITRITGIFVIILGVYLVARS